MSFSSKVKNELCRMELSDKCCMVSELAAIIHINGTLASKFDINIRIVTENAAFARRTYSSIKKLYDISPEVVTRKSKKFKNHVSYILVITSSMGADRIFESLGISYYINATDNQSNYLLSNNNVLKRTCCKKAFLRGIFLSSGAISDPEKTYHLELTSHSMAFAEQLCLLINSFDLNAKIIKRKSNYIVYLKEGENIVDFLNIIGAHSALMELENVRILKEMRNNVNRVVNCETANLDKTVNASLRQIEGIRFIKENIGFKNIPRNLRIIAEIRLEYTDASLKELGEMLEPPLGKSGVNHRLRKLEEIAVNARTLRGCIDDGRNS